MDLRVYLPLTFPLSLTEVSHRSTALLGKKKIKIKQAAWTSREAGSH